MLKKPVYLLYFVIALVCSCERHKEATEPEITGGAMIAYGKSFGECGGYCIKELTINDLDITFTASSWNNENYPAKSIKSAITVKEFNQLQSLVDMDKIKAYDDVIGCPDCADGGAEWLQVTIKDQVKKITFENGDTLETIQPLVTKLRELYTAFNKQMFPVNAGI
jgi:hypothetical protein